MPDYYFSIASALLWALSAPIVNYAIRKPAFVDQHIHVLAGLMVSLTTGVMVLSVVVLSLGLLPAIRYELVLAGIFTFPLATGIYYFAGVAFHGRADIASLFSKVKPLFSFFLAVAVLNEAVTGYTIYSAMLIGLGTLMLIVGSGFRQIQFAGVVLGLMTAVFWALGELFMKMGVSDTHPIAANLSALIAGTIVFLPFAVRPLKLVAASRAGITSLLPFCAHGVISFGIAYSCFFISIDRIGLGKSVLINAFWPVLGLLVVSMLRMSRGKPAGLPLIVILSAGILLAGSITQAVSIIVNS
jgi:drug/metabolite transporter (DMT)-like permease